MKGLAVCNGEVSTSKRRSFAESVESLTNEIEEINESQVLVELAQIEALKECAEVEALREEDYKNFSWKMAEKMKKSEAIREEIGNIEELECQLVMTLSDVNLLINELEVIQGMTKEPPRNEIFAKKEDTDVDFEATESSSLEPIADQLQLAQQELASVREEEVHLKDVINSLQKQLTDIKRETQFHISEDEADVTIGELKSKLVDAQKALRVLMLAEENGTSFVSNMSLALDQVKDRTEATKDEKMFIELETAMTDEEISKIEDKIDLTEKILASTLDELEAIKSMEVLALERLQTLTETVMERRDIESLSNSSISLSMFEYEYLTTGAEAAKEMAGRKVTAAKAWVRALNDSRNEMLMKIENARNGYGNVERKTSDSLCRAIVPIN